MRKKEAPYYIHKVASPWCAHYTKKDRAGLFAAGRCVRGTDIHQVQAFVVF